MTSPGTTTLGARGQQPAAIGAIADATSLTSSFALVTALAAGLALGAGGLRPARGRTSASGGDPADRAGSAG